MEIIQSIAAMQARARALRNAGSRIGFVPTMGYLHAGHLALVHAARQQADVVIVSIFVNPIQFGPQEDFVRYPRDFERDAALCRTAGVDILFYPATADMYTPDHSVYVEEEALSGGLCGASRPGHFRGVATIVAKLFNLVLPDFAVFGQKDYQQVRLIQQMVRDLHFPLAVIMIPTIREADGLAMSSRNQYLTPEERQSATCLFRALEEARRLYENGERAIPRLEVGLRTILSQTPSAQIEYVAIIDAKSLQPVSTSTKAILMALAVRIGRTRLIDNLVLPVD